MQAIKKNKRIAAILVAALGVVLAFGLTACGGNSASSSASGSEASASASSASESASSAAAADDKVIKVGATPTPHAEILNDAVAPLLEKAGYTLEVVEFTDYVLPNTATEDGELDANYFQHIPYLDDFNAEQGTHLVNVAGVHIEPMRIYAGKTASLDALADGAQVAVPNDTTNEARALLLLQTAGLIELNDPNDLAATPKDIKSNPKNLQFVEVEAATVPTVLQDVDIAVINTNYALGANLSNDLILVTEAGDSPYVNVIVVKEGNENTDKTKALVEAVSSQEVKDYITKTYNGEVIPV
ncbi:MAG: MetQ/NlpA family ABC transporter substrate-binding protein [Eggerthellaceae bacterium]|nr:MetQ/NlpA family ABC transporter substrate-binding protein [Eggerthellaceae bacterium]